MLKIISIATVLFALWILRPLLNWLFWAAFAWAVSRKPVARWLIRRAQLAPYTHLDGYMDRFWLFNAYDKKNGVEVTPIRWLPSVRVHHILRKDLDRHHHDHPWDARTIILDGWYRETRLEEDYFGDLDNYVYDRARGDTAQVLYGQYHTITEVSEGGVWTMFITYGYRGTWGFLVDGVKVQWREYLAGRSEA